MNRRRLLKGGSLVGFSALTGCLSGTSDDPESTPDTETGPDEPDGSPKSVEGSTADAGAESPEPDAGFEHFVSVEDGHLVVDSRRHYLVGANNCCSLMTWNPKARIDELLDDMESLGLNALRVRGYGCATHHEDDVCFQYEPAEYGDYAFEVMDYLLAQASRKQIRLIITLTDAWDVNPGGDIAEYVEWSPTADSHDDFFTDEACRTAFKRYVETFLTHENGLTGTQYRDDPTIAMWSLCNEIHAKEAGSKEAVQAWIDEMARFVKELDADHLVTPSHLGYHNRGGDAMGIDFVENHRSPDIDVCTFRVYNQNVGFQSHEEPRDEWLGVNRDEVLPWITDHVAAASEELGKPVVVEEWGWKADRTADDADRQVALRNEIYQTWVDRFAELDVDGSLVWELQTDEAYRDWGFEEEFALSYPQDEATLEVLQEYAETVSW